MELQYFLYSAPIVAVEAFCATVTVIDVEWGENGMLVWYK